MKKMKILLLCLLLISLFCVSVQAVDESRKEKLEGFLSKISELETKILETTDKFESDKLRHQLRETQMEFHEFERGRVFSMQELDAKASKCGSEFGLIDTAVATLALGEEKQLYKAKFDNIYKTKFLDRIGDSVKFEINGEQTDFIKEGELTSIGNLNLYIYSANHIQYSAWLDNPRVHFCIYEKDEAKIKQQLKEVQEKQKEIQEEVEETKGLLARIVAFLKNLFGFE